MFVRRLFLASLVALLFAAPAHAAALHQNLIYNGDAELGEVSGHESETDKTIEGWTSVAGHMVILAHEQKFDVGDLDPDPENPMTRGDNFFYGGQTSTPSVIEQTVDVSDLASIIDAGGVTFKLSGWIGGWSNHNDRLELEASFRDSTGIELHSATIGPVTNSDRNNTTGFLYREDLGDVPVGTHDVLLTMRTFDWVGANNNDGMADDLSLVFVPEPGSLALLAAGGLLLLTRRRDG